MVFINVSISLVSRLNRDELNIYQTPRNKEANLLFDITGISLIEQFSERCLVCEGIAEDLQDLIGRAFQLHAMLYNRNEAVSSDSCTDLYSDSVLGSAPEFLNLEVLL